MSGYRSAVEEIKNRCNIVDVIGSAVNLKRSGSTYKACCPFHGEKTPSFVVNEDKQFYHCFGCQESGDVFSFVQKFYNISFVESVERLAQQYGIVIEKEETQTSKKRDELFEINRMAAKYYFANLTASGNEGFKYISGRGLTSETIKTFGLGYAGTSYTGLVDYLKKNKVSEEDMLLLGLASKSEKSGKLYDKYRSRLMFPIINTRGKIIGFGGRIIGDGEPKYLNSRESDIFKKKDNLFGLNKGKPFIQQEGFAYLVEGYMDMVSLYQNGVRNVVASLGTALTENQAKLLRRYCKKVILCYDADAAGVKAALRGIDVLRAAGMEVKVLHVDDGKDPDEYIKKNGKDAFVNLTLNKSVNDVEYKAKLIAKKYKSGNTPENRVGMIRALAGVLRQLSPAEQEVYTSLISENYKIGEDTLKREISLEAPDVTTVIPAVHNAEDKNPQTVSRADINLERLALKLSFASPEYFSEIRKYNGAFVTDLGLTVSELLNKAYEKNDDLDINYFSDYLNEQALKTVNDIYYNMIIGDEKSAFEDCISRLKDKDLKNCILIIEKTIQMLEDMPQTEERDSELNKSMQKLSELRKHRK